MRRPAPHWSRFGGGTTSCRVGRLRTITEAFVDRAYNPNDTLVSAQLRGAVLHDVAEIAARTVRIVTERIVTDLDGRDIDICFDSLCVYGDTPQAVKIAAAVRHAREATSVSIVSFVG